MKATLLKNVLLVLLLCVSFLSFAQKTKAFSDSLKEVSIMLPSDWSLLTYQFPSNYYENSKQTMLFITADGMNTAIADFSAGCIIAKESNVRKKQIVDAVEMEEEGEKNSKPKLSEEEKYNQIQTSKERLTYHHHEYKNILAGYEQYKLLKTKKIKVGKYQGLLSEATYYHDNVEFRGLYHILFFTLLAQDTLITGTLECEQSQWKDLEKVFREAISTLKLQ